MKLFTIILVTVLISIAAAELFGAAADWARRSYNAKHGGTCGIAIYPDRVEVVLERNGQVIRRN